MRSFAVVSRMAAFALTITLVAAPTFAQQAPAAPAAPRPAAPAPAAPAAPAPVPFMDGSKYAFVVIPQLVSGSKEGQALTARIQALQQQKVNELNEKNKQLQAAQQKLEQGGNVLNDAARAQLQTEIERQQRDIQRFSEDAQQDVATLQQQVEQDFQRKMLPAVQRVAQAKNLHWVMSASDSGLIWGDPALDLTADVIKELDSPAPAAPRPAGQ